MTPPSWLIAAGWALAAMPAVAYPDDAPSATAADPASASGSSDAGASSVSISAGGGADAGTLPPLKFELADQVNLEGGSELAAGIDPNAGQEIIHPGNLTELKAGLRKLGSAFQPGNGTAAIQLNPFLIFGGRDMAYHDVTRIHDHALGRLLTDMSMTVALAAGSPYADSDQSRFSTLGLGFAFELLGNRSVFSSVYDQCLNGPEAKAKRIRLVRALLPVAVQNPRPGESPEDHDRRVKKFLDEHPSLHVEPQQVVDNEKQLVEDCRQKLEKRGDALYFSLGARWLTPGAHRRDGDVVVRVNRELLGAAYELHGPAGLRLVAQARLLADRPTAGDVLRTTADFGGAIQWARKSFALTVEVVQSAYNFNGSPGDGSAAGTLRLNLPRNFVLSLGIQGKGTDIGKALERIAGTITLLYKDTPLLNQPLGPSGVE